MNGIVPDRPFALKTVEEAAQYLRISKSLMQHLTAARKVAFTRLGRRIYFQQSDLDAYAARQRVEVVYYHYQPEPETEKICRMSLWRKVLVWMKIYKSKEKP